MGLCKDIGVIQGYGVLGFRHRAIKNRKQTKWNMKNETIRWTSVVYKLWSFGFSTYKLCETGSLEVRFV